MEQTITLSLATILGVQLVTAGFFAGGIVYMVRAQAKTLNRMEGWLKDHQVRLEDHNNRLTIIELITKKASS